MKLKDILSPSFKSVGHISVDFILPSLPMVNACRADTFDFFQPAIDAGLLTVDQMHHATGRYYLGKTKGGQPMFWMIDDMLQPLDAHVSPDSWISTFLKAREPLLQSWQVTHSLFGLHLISDASHHPSPICIVESEASAVVLSELFPESIWMAYVSIPHLTPDLLAPLEGHTVTIYPRTDDIMSTYLFFCDYAEQVLRFYSLDLHIDTTLENHATEVQKSRGIDILDFILEP